VYTMFALTSVPQPYPGNRFFITADPEAIVFKSNDASVVSE